MGAALTATFCGTKIKKCFKKTSLVQVVSVLFAEVAVLVLIVSVQKQCPQTVLWTVLIGKSLQLMVIKIEDINYRTPVAYSTAKAA